MQCVEAVKLFHYSCGLKVCNTIQAPNGKNNFSVSRYKVQACIWPPKCSYCHNHQLKLNRLKVSYVCKF